MASREANKEFATVLSMNKVKLVLASVALKQTILEDRVRRLEKKVSPSRKAPAATKRK